MRSPTLIPRAAKLLQLLFAQTAVAGGDALTNPTAKTAFAQTFTIPANSLKVGDVLEFEFGVELNFAGTSTQTWELAIGASLFSFAQVGASSVTTQQTTLKYQLVITAIGSSGTVSGKGGHYNPAATNRMSGARFNAVAIDTTVDNAVLLKVTNGTSNASNVDTLFHFVCTKLG